MPKPANKKKKFIDKKREETVTFSLIHRSQKDPLAADDEAPQRLLLPISETTGSRSKEELEKIKEEEREHGVFYEDDYNYMQHMKDLTKPEYDFSEVDRFLLSKDSRQNAPAKQVASSSGVSRKLQEAGLELADPTGNDDEAEVGLLNLAAPRTGPLFDWDPDIVETLDDAFDGHEVVFTAKDLEGMEDDEEDEMDELFKEALAEKEDDDDNDDEYEDISEDEEDGEERDFDSDFGGRSSDEEDDEVPDLLDARGHRLFMEEETKSRFTEYSMSSSVIRRNAQLTILDDKFEEFYAGYDDMNVGGLEADDIEGSRNVTSLDKGTAHKEGEDSGNYVMKHVLDEFEKNRESDRQQLEERERRVMAASMQENGDETKNPDKEILEMFEDKPAKDRFDCQSILSTYSTLYNHPRLIKEQSSRKKKKIDPIQISGKTGMPKDVLGRGPGLTEGALKRLDRQNNQDDSDGGDSDGDGKFETQTLASRMSALSFRNRHETAEERRARKAGMKEVKRERRMEKKANRAAFKDEEKRQEKVMASNKQNNTLKIL